MALGLLDVVSEGLLLDAGSDHLLFVVSELFIGYGWLNLTIFSLDCLKVILLEVLGISKWGSLVEVGLQSTLHIWQLALHGGVPVVLDRVVGAALEDLSDLGPLVAHDAVHEEKDPLLLFTPVNFLNTGI